MNPFIVDIVKFTISVALGSIIATLIIPLMAKIIIKKSLRDILNDGDIQKSVSSFITNHIVKPLDEAKNEDIRNLLINALQIGLERIKKEK